MNPRTDNEINTIINKHVSFALFLAIVPIIFIQLISYFSGDDQLNGLLTFLVPISSVGASAHLIKCVLIELNENRASNTKKIFKS